MKTRRKVSSVTVLIALLGLGVLAAPAYAELNAYMQLSGSKQGAIKGSVTQKGREGMIMVIASEHSMSSPSDPSTGLATGKRQHKPFVITKELDKSSVALRTALANNEALKEVVIQYYAPAAKSGAAAGGVETLYFTITLKNARISGIHHVMPNNKNPELMKLAAYEEVSFTYESITWSDGTMTDTDNWSGSAK